MAMAGLSRLPSELHCNIANHLDKEDARSFRLCCKAFHTPGTQALFSFVRLYPCDESVARFNAILNHPDINKWVRHVELNTLEKDEMDEEQGDAPEFSEEIEATFAAFPKFTNLNSVAFRFSPNASSGSSWNSESWMTWSEFPQDYEFRQPLVQKLFRTLAKPSASKINRICIDNIQNMNDKGGKFMQSDTVVNVLKRLRGLQLFITTEDHEASPENNLLMEELHIFMDELPPLWLQPASNTLTTLVLYQSSYFGYAPKLDLRGVHFPNLRTLAFGNYTFTHDWQLDWLSSHKTLENLYLDDCIVLYFAYLLESPLDEDGYPQFHTLPSKSNSTVRESAREYQFIDMTWAKIFKHLSSHLPSLLKFRVGTSPRWDRRRMCKFDRLDYEQTSIRLNADRYMMFHGGIGPSQYTDDLTNGRRHGGMDTAAENFDREFGKREGLDAECAAKARAFLGQLQQQEKEDKETLEDLLRVIGHPVTEETVQIQESRGYCWSFGEDSFPTSY